MKYLTLLFVLIAPLTYGQEVDIPKKNLKKIFRQNAKGTTHGWKKGSDIQKDENHYMSYNEWLTGNCDSSYTSFDTLTFYNYNYYQPEDCRCERTTWGYTRSNFFKRRDFYIAGKTCNSSYPLDLYYKISVKRNGQRIEIRRAEKHFRRTITKFEVVSLKRVLVDKESDTPMYVLKLKRIE